MKCLYCKNELKGRVDKKFCTPYCKSAYHYENSKQNEKSLFQKIDKHLKLNRKILKSYNKSGLSTVKKQKLLAEGFTPQYFTHYWKNKEEKVYLFCYEYGFLSHNNKYILVIWQDYMNT